MGSPADERGRLGRLSNESQHKVTLTHGFWMHTKEVTRQELSKLAGYMPPFSRSLAKADPGPQGPVEVSWHEAASYCNALSALDGFDRCYDCAGEGASVRCNRRQEFESPYLCPGYRLPTEAEWEYAARSGTKTATHAGNLDAKQLGCESPNPVLDAIAWHCGNSDGSIKSVGTRSPTPWGLFDMLGNVWEWCDDWFDDYPSGPVVDPWGPPEERSGQGRSCRGATAKSQARMLRSAQRGSHDATYHSGTGFRPVRSIL